MTNLADELERLDADSFNGDNAALVRSITALIALNKRAAFPNPVPGLAVQLLTTAAHRLSALRGEQWQGIETAPKDGREINGYRPDQGVFTFRWAWAEEFVPKGQNGDPTEDYDENFAWWWHDLWGWMEGDETPTHWRPLPPPPKGTDG